MFIYIYIYIYVYEVQLGFVQNQISWSLSLFSLYPNLTFSPKTFLPSSFRPNPNIFHLVSALNFFIFPFLMHFMHLNLGFQVFWERFGVFVFLTKFLGWMLLIWFHMLMHCILCHYNHVFMHSRLCAWLYNVSAIGWIGFHTWCNFFNT